MAKIITKGGDSKFLQIDRVCNNCNHITTVDEPIFESTSRGSKSFYKKNIVATCGNCGAAL